MKLWEVFRFEVGYQVRRGWPWLFALVLFVLTFLMARDTSLSDALFQEFFANSPFAVAKTTVFGGLLWLVMAAAIAGEAAARDVATGMHPLIYTTTLTRAEYLGGRFLAAFAINAGLLALVQVAIIAAVYAPGVDPRVIGPFRPAAFLTSYAILSLPNAFFGTAIQFAVATRSGRPMAAYIGSLGLFFSAFFVASLLLFKRGLGTLLDPIGVRFIWEDLSHLWTTIEKSRRLLAWEGAILQNRLVWIGAGLAALALSYLRFRFAHRTEPLWWWQRKRHRHAQAPVSAGTGMPAARVAVPAAARSFGVVMQARQALAIAGASFRTTAMSLPGLALLVFIPLLSVVIVIDQMVAVGAPLIPTTARVLRELTGPLSAELSRWIVVPFFIIFFAGELVWREREAGLGEMTDAMPGSDWTPLLGKFLGIGLVLVALQTFLMAAGMLAQTLMGYGNYEIGLYLIIQFGLQLPEYLLFVVVALVVHGLINQKYVAHVAAVLVYVFIIILATMLGIEHNMLIYGSGPVWSYTEMRHFGQTIWPWLWFKLYWAGWALVLAVVGRLLWVRGKESGFRVRIGMARRRFTRPTAWVSAAAMALVLGAGGFVFYNVHILNEYRGGADIEERRAEYERRYRRYEHIPQPRLAGANLRVDIHPRQRAVEISGSYRLVNGSAVPIDSIHVALGLGAVTGAVRFDRPSTLAAGDDAHGYRIYALERPLRPGDTLRLDFEAHVRRQGFGNRGIDPAVVASGSGFTSRNWFPFVGYQRWRELMAPAQRRDHGLEPRPILASVYSVEAAEPATRGGGIAFEAVVGTDEDQVAVAPGALQRTWTAGGRRYFQYAADAPIGSEWAFFSAGYAVHEARFNDVAIRIYHDPDHIAHLPGMTRGIQATLDYYGRQFGPYPYRHLTAIEHPGAPGLGMHAEASTFYYGQSYEFWHPRTAQSFDFTYAVLAHEMAHQWTLPYALVEGLPFLSEGLAWYSAIRLVKESRGEEQARRLLAFMREPYPHRPIRRGEPLLRAMDPYLAYRRGPFAMFALSEYVGADRVNGAIRRLIERSDAPGSPKATTLDLYRELQAVTPDSLRFLLHDLFEVNTLWQLKTERTSAVQNADSTWRVTLDVLARKIVYDSAGVETEVAMDEWVPVGVFAYAEGRDAELSAPLYLRMHRVRSGRQTITVTVRGRPDLAGIDPHHLLDWEEENDDDNIEAVTIGR